MSNQVIIDYTNWRGERNKRTVVPIKLVWGSNQWHPVDQWLLIARDGADDNAPIKTFAMRGIYSWEAAT